MKEKHEPIPADFVVQPLQPGQPAKARATCGHCELSWDDGISTSLTPTPSARCPFEYFHVYESETKTVFQVWDNQFHRSGTPEVVFAGKTPGEAEAYIQGACDNGRPRGCFSVEEKED